jgi:heme-degrading monooxygenase HmoA
MAPVRCPASTTGARMARASGAARPAAASYPRSRASVVDHDPRGINHLAFGRRMHVIAYRYRVTPEQVADFERVYGSAGDWARFFAAGEGYLGTDLLRSKDGDYLLLDRWEAASRFEAFLAVHGEEYKARNREAQALWSYEERLGAFDAMPAQH